jgi:AcrR family transcriptional regulator
MGRKPTTKSRLKRPDKQHEIVVQLTEFFKQNRLSESSMDDVALYLNKSKATIYKYFKSKEQIVEAIIDTKVKEIAGFVFILRNENIDFFKRYELSYDLLASHIADISNELLIDLKELYPEIYLKIENLIDLAVGELKSYYEEGMRKGIFNKLNSSILAQNDLMFFRLLTNPEFLVSNGITMEEAFADFYKIRCFGLLKQN